ncbi:MAG TPA: TonB-dependent receptor [Bacteroidales bacterium]|nr:TonB-dependent receptor [Bacteroidales bacterium]
MKRLIILAFLIIPVAIQAQNIKGKVYYEKDRTPVQFASVALLQLPDSSISTGVITLTDGGYLLERIKPGNYFVKVSFLGFRPAGKPVSVTQGQGDITVDTIFLAEATATLGEVTVVGERLKGEEMVDRTVYKVPELVSKASSNGYDILKKVPQVNVDFQNNITLNGSSNFIIQVDGRQRDREYLARLLPTDIQSIEVITNPSSKYEGNIDGVINIVLRKEARFGVSGNVAGSLKPFNKVTSAATGSLDYAVGKITFYLTGMIIGQELDIKSTVDNRFTSIDSLTSQNGKGKIKVGMSSVNTGFDYYLNEKNNLSFNISYKPVNQKVFVDANTLLYKGADPLNTVASLTSNKTNSDETSGSLFYKKLFKKPVEELTAEASFYTFRSADENDFTNTTYPFNDDIVLSNYSRYENNVNHRNYISGKIDYVYPLGLSGKLEAGYQGYYQNMNYDFTIDNVEEDNMFEYSEIRNSVYSGLTLNIKKFGLQAMLRVENSHIIADSVSEPDYSCFLPSANVQYKISASHNLKLTYNRRINRPGIYDMNPAWKTSQDFMVSQGNPNLRPDYRDRLQLTYTWNFGSNYLSPYVYDEFFTNKIGSRYNIIRSPIDGSVTTISKPYNLLDGYEAGGGINTMLWYVNINARIFKGHYNGYSEQSFSIPERDYFSYAITSYAFANLDKKKKSTAFLYLAYNGVNINAQSKTYSLPLYGCGFQQQIKDHNLGVFWLLPFSRTIKFQRIETETAAFNSTNVTGINMAAFIQFSYSYKFNKGRNVRKLDRKLEIESDSKSQTIGR